MLRVHFLNVGHGDCTVIEHPSGRLTMIDINNSQDYDSASFREYAAEHRRPRLHRPGDAFAELVEVFTLREQSKKELCDPVEFMKAVYPGRRIWRFILSHPDLDHMRGIKRLDDEIGFNCFWDTGHNKSTPEFRGDADREDWEYYQQLRQGPKMRSFSRGDCHFAFGKDEYGNEGGDNIEILSPTRALLMYCDAAQNANEASYALRVSHAGLSILLTGDMESVAWDSLVRTYGIGLRSNILCASHHGRETGFHLPAIKLIQPAVTIVSVGRKPSTDASRKYCGQCKYIFSTRYHGNITLVVDDFGSDTWYFARNAQVA
jgi:competence protein ComEC